MTDRILAPIVVAACAVVLAVPVGATVHIVDVVNLAFVPGDITVTAGDTVRWVHSGQAHTVTSGDASLSQGARCNVHRAFARGGGWVVTRPRWP